MPQPADFLITHARAFTSDPTNPTAEAVAVKGNRIVFVGAAAEATKWRGSATRLIDAGGRTLIPGFIDSHFHLLHGSLKLDGIQLEEAKEYESIAAEVKAFAAAHPNDSWLVGYSLRYNLGPGHTLLTRQHLDAIIADRPLIVFAYDFHTAWANTLALKMAGIFNGGECGPNSEIVLNERGEATGELRESGAYDRIRNLLPQPDDHQKRALLHKGLRQAAQLGVTSVHNMNCEPGEAELYAALEDTGELTCRVYVPYSFWPDIPFEALADEAVALREKFQSDMVRGGAVKFFMDGVIESYTGLLVNPYADDPNTNGGANYAPEYFTRLAVESDRLGLQIFVHAVGDLAVRRVLDGYETAQRLNGKRDSRHRVEHIEVIHPDDLPRFAQLGVIASMQPLHCPTLNDGDVWQGRVGPQRWPLSFAWQTLRQAGAKLAFGSDWPVVSQNPMLGVDAAVNRTLWQTGLPDQRQTLANTLVAYTRDAAYAEFQEGQKGQLKAGYLADMVLLSEDIFSIPGEQLASVRPVLTVCDGRVVYEA